MNTGRERIRKSSMYDASPPAIVASQKQINSRRRRCIQAKRDSRDKDFFAPDQIEEWVLPEYKSLFHHLFIKEDEDSGCMPSGVARRHSVSSPSSSGRTRRPSTTESTRSASSSTSADGDLDGPLCNFVKSFPGWLKKVFNISDDNEHQHIEEEREAWLDEIPIEICDRLRHIHIYV